MLVPALLCLLGASAPQASPSKDGLAAVRAVLQRTEGSTKAPEDVLVRRLTALGSAAGPALFDLVTGEAIPALLVDDTPEAWLCSPDVIGELALAALVTLPQVPLRDFLEARLAQRAEHDTRIAALRVLGRQGSADGLALLLEVCGACGEELEHRALRLPAIEALAAILAGDGQALRMLETPLLDAPIALQRMATEALATCGRADAMGLLTKLFGRDPELDLAALEGLACLGERYSWLLGEPVAVRLRMALERGAPSLRAVAARALGRTLDLKAVPLLIACLEDADPATARAAQWALREITGQTRLTERAQWLSWFTTERDWWERDGRARLAALDAAEPAGLTVALRELLTHPLCRDELADQLGTMLGALDAPAKVIACDALARFKARRAVPALVELLFESELAVRTAAWKALCTLTGENLPAEPRLWEAYTAGS